MNKSLTQYAWVAFFSDLSNVWTHVVILFYGLEKNSKK